jgi:nitroreductase
METLEAIGARRSVRQFENRPVPRELLETLVDAGRLAPTANNVQPWEFVVVTDESVKNRVAAITDHGKFIADAPAMIAVFSKDTKYYLEDGCAATTSILIAATGLGLGACWVAGDKKPYCDKICSVLGVPADHRLVSLIPVGYPAGPAGSASKRALQDLIHWDKF